MFWAFSRNISKRALQLNRRSWLMHWMAKQRCRDRQGEVKRWTRWTARLLESPESWIQFPQLGISPDVSFQYLKLHQVQIKFIKLISGGGSRSSSKASCQILTLMNGWMDEVENERNGFSQTLNIFKSFYSRCSKASWFNCEQSGKLARKEILQKLNVTMQKRVSKAESSKAKIYNARTSRHHGIGNLWSICGINSYQLYQFNGLILILYVICVAV